MSFVAPVPVRKRGPGRERQSLEVLWNQAGPDTV
jgi:hypothetical protein